MKRKELKTRLASLMVYLELRECTNARNFISYRDMEKRLEEKYGRELRPSHNTIYEILKEMVIRSESGELGINVVQGNSRQGYSLRSREFEEWEIELFIEYILNSKTLSAIDKKNLIDKCFTYLGCVSEKRIDEIYDYLFDKTDAYKKKRLPKKEDVEETMEQLSSAITDEWQVDVEILYHEIGPDRIYTTKRRQAIHPYRVFERNGLSYLIYGKQIKNRYFVFYDRIDNIRVLNIRKEKTIPLESAKGYEKGINEKQLRKDPFGYLTRSSQEETVIAESLIDDEKIQRISKGEVEAYFGENVSFYHDKNKEYIYIDGDYEKSLNWFLLHSGEWKVTAPESMVKLLKAYSRSLQKTYSDENDPVDGYQNENTLINHMYRNKRTYIKTKQKE